MKNLHKMLYTPNLPAHQVHYIAREMLDIVFEQKISYPQQWQSNQWVSGGHYLAVGVTNTRRKPALFTVRRSLRATIVPPSHSMNASAE
jgi:hypothetical protein